MAAPFCSKYCFDRHPVKGSEQTSTSLGVPDTVGATAIICQEDPDKTIEEKAVLTTKEAGTIAEEVEKTFGCHPDEKVKRQREYEETKEPQ